MILKNKLTKISTGVTVFLSLAKIVLPLILPPEKAAEIISLIDSAITVFLGAGIYGVRRNMDTRGA